MFFFNVKNIRITFLICTCVFCASFTLREKKNTIRTYTDVAYVVSICFLLSFFFHAIRFVYYCGSIDDGYSCIGSNIFTELNENANWYHFRKIKRNVLFNESEISFDCMQAIRVYSSLWLALNFGHLFIRLESRFLNRNQMQFPFIDKIRK